MLAIAAVIIVCGAVVELIALIIRHIISRID